MSNYQDPYLDNKVVEAVIKLAEAAKLIGQPAAALVSAALPNSDFKEEEIAMIAALGKVRELRGLKPEDLSFRISLSDNGEAERRVFLSFNHTSKWRESAGLSADIINYAKATMSDNAGSPKELGGYVGWQDYDTGAIASMDNGELVNFPLNKVTEVAGELAEIMQKAQQRKLESAKSASLS